MILRMKCPILKVSTHFKELVMEWIIGFTRVGNMLYGIKQSQVLLFGRLDQLGLYGHVLRSNVKIIENECPNNEGYVWNWEYKDSGTWTATNDVYIKCVDEGNC